MNYKFPWQGDQRTFRNKAQGCLKLHLNVYDPFWPPQIYVVLSSHPDALRGCFGGNKNGGIPQLGQCAEGIEKCRGADVCMRSKG